MHTKKELSGKLGHMATHSGTLALKIPWMEELGAGYCPWGRKESGTTERLQKKKKKITNR